MFMMQGILEEKAESIVKALISEATGVKTSGWWQAHVHFSHIWSVRCCCSCHATHGHKDMYTETFPFLGIN